LRRETAGWAKFIHCNGAGNVPDYRHKSLSLGWLAGRIPNPYERSGQDFHSSMI
jgi:hypothetical protein